MEEKGRVVELLFFTKGEKRHTLVSGGAGGELESWVMGEGRGQRMLGR